MRPGLPALTTTLAAAEPAFPLAAAGARRFFSTSWSIPTCHTATSRYILFVIVYPRVIGLAGDGYDGGGAGGSVVRKRGSMSELSGGAGVVYGEVTRGDRPVQPRHPALASFKRAREQGRKQLAEQ